ncbi:MAG: Flp family type IVb pilin [Dongiaceae bacterium]
MSNLIVAARFMLRRFVKDESGASLIEYSILIGLITVLVIGLITGVGGWVESQWNALTSATVNAT